MRGRGREGAEGEGGRGGGGGGREEFYMCIDLRECKYERKSLRLIG